MQNTHRPDSGVAQTGTRLLKTLLKGAEYRLELLLLEWQEEKAGFIARMLWLLMAAGALFLAILALNLVLVVAFWESHRLALAIGLAVFYLLLSLVLFVVVRAKFKISGPLFPATRSALKEDLTFLRQSDEGN